MTDNDDTGGLRSIRVTSRYLPTSALTRTEADVPAMAGRPSFLVVPDPRAPITVTDVTATPGILFGSRGVLGPAGLAHRPVGYPFPELVVRSLLVSNPDETSVRPAETDPHRQGEPGEPGRPWPGQRDSTRPGAETSAPDLTSAPGQRGDGTSSTDPDPNPGESVPEPATGGSATERPKQAMSSEATSREVSVKKAGASTGSRPVTRGGRTAGTDVRRVGTDPGVRRRESAPMPVAGHRSLRRLSRTGGVDDTNRLGPGPTGPSTVRVRERTGPTEQRSGAAAERRAGVTAFPMAPAFRYVSQSVPEGKEDTDGIEPADTSPESTTASESVRGPTAAPTEPTAVRPPDEPMVRVERMRKATAERTDDSAGRTDDSSTESWEPRTTAAGEPSRVPDPDYRARLAGRRVPLSVVRRTGTPPLERMADRQATPGQQTGPSLPGVESGPGPSDRAPRPGEGPQSGETDSTPHLSTSRPTFTVTGPTHGERTPYPTRAVALTGTEAAQPRSAPGSDPSIPSRTDTETPGRADTETLKRPGVTTAGSEPSRVPGRDYRAGLADRRVPLSVVGRTGTSPRERSPGRQGDSIQSLMQRSATSRAEVEAGSGPPDTKTGPRPRTGGPHPPQTTSPPRPSFTVTGPERTGRDSTRTTRPPAGTEPVSRPDRRVPLVTHRRMQRERGGPDSTHETRGAGGTAGGAVDGTTGDAVDGTAGGAVGGIDGPGGQQPSVATALQAGEETLIDFRAGGSMEMPSLTLRDRGGERGTSGEREPRGTSRMASSGSGGRRQRREGRGPGDASGPDGAYPSGDDDLSSRADRTARTAGRTQAGARERERTQRPARGDEPLAGRDVSSLYPEFTFKTLAPRIDATSREDPPRRDITYSDAGGDRRNRREPWTDRVDLDEELLSSGGSERARYPSEGDRLVESLRRRIKRKRRIDRERRGL